MSTELTAETLIPLSVKERKELIMYHASLIDATNIVDEDLQTAWNMISMDYDLVENHIRDMLQKIDKVFAELAIK